MKRKMIGLIFSLLIIAAIIPGQVKSQALKENPQLDEKVKAFLSDHAGQWHDMNVPAI